VGYNFVADIMGHWVYIYLAIVALQNSEITRNTDKIWHYSSSGSSKVIDLGVKVIAGHPRNPLECRDEVWHQKTRIVGLPHGEDITIPACDRQTDRHVAVAKTRAIA